jgi:hypothetical protein
LKIRLLWTSILMLLLLVACDNVSFVDRVVLVNDTDYHANADVRGVMGGWLGLTTVGTGETTEVGEVIDQGEVWIFRFSYGSHDPVELEVTREELVAANWRVDVPSELEENLRDEGVPPPPP